MLGAYVSATFDAIWPGTAGIGQENSLARHTAGDLHAPLLAKLGEIAALRRGGTEDAHVVASSRFAPSTGTAHPVSLPFPEVASVVQGDCDELGCHAHSS